MSLGWKIFLGTLAVVGGGTYFLLRKNKPLSFENYCQNCVAIASEHMNTTSIDVVKSILIIKKLDDDSIFPVLYTRKKDGKIYKTEFRNRTFPLEHCPENVRNELLDKSEYIIHKF